MATDSVLGLFQTPDQYQLAQQAAQMEQARQYAAQDPMQRAVASQYFAGGQLGRALGGEDPALKMASARQQILKGVNPQDMKSIEEAAIQFSRLGDGAGVQAMQELAFKQSQITRNVREAKTADQRNYETAVSQGYRGTLQDFILQQRRAGATQVGFSPEIKMTDKELDWRKQFLSENKPVIEQAANVQQALGLLQQSQQSPFADAAFKNTVVSAFGGDKQKSNAEIDRFVKAGSLDERVANTIKGFFEGTTSAKTKEDQLKVLTAVDKVLEQRYNSSAQSWSKRLSASKVNPELVVPAYGETVGATSASIPVGKTVRNKAGEKFTVNADGTLTPVGK